MDFALRATVIVEFYQLLISTRAAIEARTRRIVRAFYKSKLQALIPVGRQTN